MQKRGTIESKDIMKSDGVGGSGGRVRNLKMQELKVPRCRQISGCKPLQRHTWGCFRSLLPPLSPSSSWRPKLPHRTRWGQGRARQSSLRHSPARRNLMTWLRLGFWCTELLPLEDSSYSDPSRNCVSTWGSGKLLGNKFFVWVENGYGFPWEKALDSCVPFSISIF